MRVAFAVAALLGISAPALAEGMPTTIIGPGEEALAIERIPAPGGEVILPTAKDKAQNHDTYHYAAVRRLGPVLHLSGVVAGRLPGEGTDAEAARAAIRRAFRTIERNLGAAGANMADIAEIRVHAAPEARNFKGDAAALLRLYGDVKDEFVKAPYPAETYVNVASLVEPTGLMEISILARAHGKPRGKRADAKTEDAAETPKP